MGVKVFFIARGLMLVALLGISCPGYGMEMRGVSEDVETVPLSPRQSRPQQTPFEYSNATPWVTSMSHAVSPRATPKRGVGDSNLATVTPAEVHPATSFLLETIAGSLRNAESQKDIVEILKGLLAVVVTNQGIAQSQTSSGIAQTNVQVGQEAWKTRLWGLVGAAVTSLIAIIPQFVAYYGTGVDCNGHAHNSTMSS